MQILNDNNKNLCMARRIALAVAEKGGTAYYVGGFVRDHLMGNETKDVDLEIHGISPEILSSILDTLGEKTVMGAHFGVFGLRHYTIDIAMPRMETATGKGHRDFQVFVDPFLGPQKAATRRDFTINALMQNVLTDEILDFFHGTEDLKDGIIRHVSEKTFAEDPLRILRAAQFASRFGFHVAEDTIRLSKETVLGALAKERVFGELEKALTKGIKPSVFFEVLRQMDGLSYWFPAIRRVSEDKAQWQKSLIFLDLAASHRNDAEQPLAFMLAALCLAFPDSVQNPVNTIRKLSDDRKLLHYCENIAKQIPTIQALIVADSSSFDFACLYDKSVCTTDLIILATAFLDLPTNAVERLKNERDAYQVLIAKPCITGKDLSAVGMKEGKEMGEALSFAHELHLKNIPKERALKEVLALFSDKL